jgi:hypothetical protein
VEAEQLWDAEEEVKCVASKVKVAALEVRRQALVQAQELLRSDFCAKRITKEELRVQNIDLEEEQRMIERKDARGEVVKDDEEHMTGVGGDFGGEVEVCKHAKDKEGETELPVTEYGKRKVVELGEDGEDEIDAKRTRFASTGLLEFDGPVSLCLCLYFSGPS